MLHQPRAAGSLVVLHLQQASAAISDVAAGDEDGNVDDIKRTDDAVSAPCF